MPVWIISGAETSTATVTRCLLLHPAPSCTKTGLQVARRLGIPNLEFQIVTRDQGSKVGQSYLLLACVDSPKLFSPDPFTHTHKGEDPV